LDRSKRHIKAAAICAGLLTFFLLAVRVVQKLVGFSKFNPNLRPKTVNEVVAEWPELLVMGCVIFMITWWWQASKKEQRYVICPSCLEPYEKEENLNQFCKKCHGLVEDLDGFYERHPELRKKSDELQALQQAKSGKEFFKTCPECGKTFYEQDCPDLCCPECSVGRRH